MSATDELQRLCAEGGSHTRIKYLRSKIKRATIAELRKLLRERGVRFNEFKLMTQWAGALGESVEAYPTDTFPDTLLVKHAYLTPAQAIAATLGSGTVEKAAERIEVLSGFAREYLHRYGMLMSMAGEDVTDEVLAMESVINEVCGRKEVTS